MRYISCKLRIKFIIKPDTKRSLNAPHYAFVSLYVSTCVYYFGMRANFCIHIRGRIRPPKTVYNCRANNRNYPNWLSPRRRNVHTAISLADTRASFRLFVLRTIIPRALASNLTSFARQLPTSYTGPILISKHTHTRHTRNVYIPGA